MGSITLRKYVSKSIANAIRKAVQLNKMRILREIQETRATQRNPDNSGHLLNREILVIWEILEIRKPHRDPGNYGIWKFRKVHPVGTFVAQI